MDFRAFAKSGSLYLVIVSALLLPAFASAQTTPTFNVNHQLWDEGPDILQLQQWLNANGYPVAQTGAGSPGNETNIFGPHTYHALINFQAAHDLPQTGYFGPLTRAAIASTGASSATQSSVGTPNAGSAGSASSTSSQYIPGVTPLPGYAPGQIIFAGGGGGNSSTALSCSIFASSPIAINASTLLSWSSSNAISASLQIIGSTTSAVATASSENISPTTTTAYLLTVTGSLGATASCDTTVVVSGSLNPPPNVSVTAPSSGATVGGTVTLTAAATSSTLVIADVQFKVDGANIGSPIFSAPYTTTWNSTGVSDGTHTLSAVAEDTGGNLATSTVTITVRNSPPVLSSISTIASYFSATTTWTTDEAANSKVVYGFTTAYGLASSSASLLTSHSIALSALTASSTYHYAVVSTDAESNTATSSDQTFITSATSTPPVISSISSTATTTSATVIWTTNLSATSEVVYGTTTSYGTASSSAALLTSHSITISGLATSTTYHYEIVSATTFGATATSSDQTLTTSNGVADYTPPSEPTDLVATPESSSEISLSWNASTGNGVDPVAGYQIFRDGIQVATDTSDTTFNDTGLNPSTLHSYWIDAYDTANNISTSTNGVSALTEAGADAYGTTWKPLTLGAGGTLTGMDIAPDGTMVVRADAYGAYLWDGTQWDQLVSSSSMPADVQIPNGGDGVNEIRIAPSDSNIMYMEYEGYIFKSINRGVTWTQTNFARVPETTIEGGDDYRQWGQKMAVDPENPNVIYAGTRQKGLFISTNGGTSWQSESAVATGTVNNGTYYAGINGIQFDPTLGVSGGETKTIFVSAAGDGVYESTTTGATWTLLSGGPSIVIYSAVASSTGTYYAVDNDNNLWSYASGTWTELLSGADGIQTISIDPFNNNEIVVTSNGGYFDVSYNGGSTWSGYDTFYNGVSNYNELNSSDIPWLADTGPYMDIDAVLFDPITPNKLWGADGVGVWETTSVPSSSFSNEATVTWNDQSLGIEELVANGIVTPPGGNPVVAVQDRPFFYKTTPDAYPSSYSPVMGDNIVAGDSIDYASSNANFLVGIADTFGSEEFGYSTNGGQTWTDFPAFLSGADSSFIGGTIAASTPSNIIWAPADGFDPYYTTNGGTTWNAVALPGSLQVGPVSTSRIISTRGPLLRIAYFLIRSICTTTAAAVRTGYTKPRTAARTGPKNLAG